MSSLLWNFFLESSPESYVISTCDDEIINYRSAALHCENGCKSTKTHIHYSTAHHSIIFYDHITNAYLGVFYQ